MCFLVERLTKVWTIHRTVSSSSYFCVEFVVPLHFRSNCGFFSKSPILLEYLLPLKLYCVCSVVNQLTLCCALKKFCHMFFLCEHCLKIEKKPEKKAIKSVTVVLDLLDSPFDSVGLICKVFTGDWATDEVLRASARPDSGGHRAIFWSSRCKLQYVSLLLCVADL